jgi:hypothetical protein
MTLSLGVILLTAGSTTPGLEVADDAKQGLILEAQFSH